MRLINTSTLTLTEHPDSKLPDSGYAILSHRWFDASNEVTFEDLQLNRDVSHKRGLAKLQNFCSTALSRGYEYAWCNTCCIDKASAVELGSSINSMYRWYKNAKICFAYLSDVHENGVSLFDSEWFQRGWTLQELIAPTSLEFFDRDWRRIGTKHENIEALSSNTRIPISVLKDSSTLSSCSIAQRMSWAAKRITERVEDRAYSLLGLFDISLDMIYGEQERSFVRLQEKLIQYSADQSIFVWSMSARDDKEMVSGLLGPSPSSFGDCGNVLKGPESLAFSQTNVGLRIRLRTGNPTSVCAILISKLDGEGQWARVGNKAHSVFTCPKSEPARVRSIERDICVRQSPAPVPIRAHRQYGFWLREIKPPHHDTCKIKVISRSTSPEEDRVFLEPGQFGTADIVSLEPQARSRDRWSQLRWIKIGFDDEFQPTVMIANSHSHAINARFTETCVEAETQGIASTAHQKLFDNTWLRTGRLRDQLRVPAIEDGWAQGAYVLTHKKILWPDYKYRVPALNLGINFSLVPAITPEATTNGSTKCIWTVEVITLGEMSPEQERRDELCNIWMGILCIGLPVGLLGQWGPYFHHCARLRRASGRA